MFVKDAFGTEAVFRLDAQICRGLEARYRSRPANEDVRTRKSEPDERGGKEDERRYADNGLVSRMQIGDSRATRRQARACNRTCEREATLSDGCRRGRGRCGERKSTGCCHPVVHCAQSEQ